jgi:opacity protein-like surface antigen
MSHTLSFQLLFVTIWVFLTVSSASAKWFVDLYGGGAVLEGNDVTVTSDKLSVSGISPGNQLQGLSVHATMKDVEGDDFPFGGVRVGYWFDDAIPYLGIGVDLIPFFLHTPAQRVRADSNATIEVEIDDDRFVIDRGTNLPTQLPPIGEITGILSFDVMARYFVQQSTAFPQGQLQPYLTLAPALLLTDDSPDVAVGVKVGAGLRWYFTERLALFAEYRFTHFNPTIELQSLRVRVADIAVKAKNPEIETDLNVHYGILGLSYQF